MKLSIEKKLMEEIEVTPPLFWKLKEGHTDNYIAWLDAETVIQLEITDGRARTIFCWPEWLSKGAIGKAYHSYGVISEEEFLAAHESALQSLSLIPKLTEK